MDQMAIREKIEAFSLVNEVFATGAISNAERDKLQKAVCTEIRTLIGL